MKVEPLLCIFNPRNIPEALISYSKINNYDKLWIGRQRFYQASRTAISHLLVSKTHTHMAIVIDDLVISQNAVDTLVRDLEENSHIEVIGTPTNANVSELGQRYYGVQLFDIPAKNHLERQYNRLPIRHAPTSGIFPVAHQGLALEFISKRLFQDRIVTLENELLADVTKDHNKDQLELVMHPKKAGCCEDVVLSHQLAEAGIKQYVDFSVRTKHLKPKPKHPTNLLVGIEEPFVRFEPKSRR